MKKKILLFMGLLFASLPLCVSAEDSLSVTGFKVSCGKETLKPEESTTCTITGTTSKAVNYTYLELTKTNLIFEDVKFNGWDKVSNSEVISSDKSSYKVAVTNKTATKTITATFKLSVKKSTPEGKINLPINVQYAIYSDLTKIASPADEFVNVKNTAGELPNLTIVVPITDNTLSTIGYSTSTKSSPASAAEKTITVTKDKDEYEIKLDRTINAIKIFAKPTKDLAKENISGASLIPGGTGNRLDLDYGLTTHKIIVKNELGEAKTYTLKITREDPRLLKSLKVNDKAIELKDGVYTYNLKVDYKVKEASVEAILNDITNGEFKDKLGSRDGIKLSVGLNEIQVVTYPKDDKESTLVYKIVINRLDESGKDTTVKNTTTTKNPKTFGGQDLGIFGGIIVIVAAGYVLLRKKSKFPNA